MAWTTPATLVDGVRYVAAFFNIQLRDNMNALRGGGIAVSGQVANDFIFASSTTQLDTLAAVEGAGPVFSGGQWTMAASAGSSNSASAVIAADSFN